MQNEFVSLKKMNAWHALTKEAIFNFLKSTPTGLTSAEAEKRLAQYGLNCLPSAKKRTWYARLVSHINNMLIYILLISSVIAFFLGHTVDASVILLVIIVNAVIGYVQEGKAEKALDAIQHMVPPIASVLRDDNHIALHAKQIVPGDIILLEAGDRVPADLRLFRTKSLRIEEATLTGESVPIEKSSEQIDEDTPIAEQSNIAFSGTFVVAGQGTGIAVRTGSDTELGQINAMLSTVESMKTPLLRQIDRLAKQLTIAILLTAVILFIFAYYFRNYDLAMALMIVVGYSVAVVPEGLPAVMTITMAIGVHRMAKRNAIIRRLPAVETLGAVSVICSDKTGTLTRNEMAVQHIVTDKTILTISNHGYEPIGIFQQDHHEIDVNTKKNVLALCRAALLCNDARLHKTKIGWHLKGDPMEGALISLAMKAGFEQELVRKQLPRIDEIPFDPAYRFMATLHHDHEQGNKFMIVKGAPEQIISMCDFQQDESGDHPIDSAFWLAQIEKMAFQGERVLALAVKQLAINTSEIIFANAKNGLTLLGLVGLIDPPRAEAIAAVHACKKGGIRVVMITGDHATTAIAIARQLDLASDPKALTGRDLQMMDDKTLLTIIEEVTVFARVNPEHKLRLVQAFQTDGEVIAMTGDGVNDAPALKQADVGIAMGKKGTAVAREAAEIVLADDNFASIADAVREGRTVYDNLRKMIAWTLPTNVGEVLAIIVAVIFALPLPITPVQILWVNMITSVGLGLVLAFEPSEPGTMQRPPRNVKESIITPFMLWRIMFVSLLFVTSAFGVFYYALEKYIQIEIAQTLVVNVIVVLEIFYLFSVRYVHGTSLTFQGLLGTTPVLIGVATCIVAQFALTYVPFLNEIFGTQPVSFFDGILVISIGILFLMIVEIEKRMRKIFGMKDV